MELHLAPSDHPGASQGAEDEKKSPTSACTAASFTSGREDSNGFLNSRLYLMIISYLRDLPRVNRRDHPVDSMFIIPVYCSSLPEQVKV